MILEEDRRFVRSLIVASRRERLPFEMIVARLDHEITQRSHPPSWLIEASLGRSREAVLDALAKVLGSPAGEDAAWARHEAGAVASAVLDGSMSPILGARELMGLLPRAGAPDGDPDLVAVAAIVSETDVLPVGDVQHEWAPEALLRMDVEIKKGEAWALETRASAFRSIAERWRAGPTNKETL